MQRTRVISALGVAALGLLLFGAQYAFAHCDGLDGPVVMAAQKALATTDVREIQDFLSSRLGEDLPGGEKFGER